MQDRNHPQIKSPMGRGRQKKHKIFYQSRKKEPRQEIDKKMNRWRRWRNNRPKRNHTRTVQILQKILHDKNMKKNIKVREDKNSI